MKPIYKSLLFVLIIFSVAIQSYSQTAGTSVCMELSNVVLTAPNEFTFDIYLRNTGTTTVALRGYAGGLNLTPGFANGGLITSTFVSRDTSLINIPAVSANYYSTSYHFRFTTTNAAAGNEVVLTPMLPYRLATFKLTSTVNFDPLLGTGYDPFNPISPATPLQLNIEPNRLNCEIRCLINPITPSDTTFRLIGTGNSVTAPEYLLVLSGGYNSWGTCSSIATIMNDQTLTAYKLKHDQTYSRLEIQSDKTNEPLSVRIYDVTGQIIVKKDHLFGTNFMIDFSNHPSGFYILTMQNGRNSKVIKFVKN